MLVVTVDPVVSDAAADEDDVDDGDIDEADDGDAMKGMLLVMTVVGRSGERLAVVTTEPIVGDCRFIVFCFCWAGAPLDCCCMTALNLF